MRRLPIVFGRMSRRGVPDEMMHAWLAPLARWEIRRDLAKYAGDARRGRRDMLAATAAPPSFAHPVLIAWASEHRLTAPAHARRLAGQFSDARLDEVADSYTLVPIDQPHWLAEQLQRFIAV